MLFKFLFLFFLILITSTSHCQENSQLTHYQLKIKNKIYPYYLTIEKKHFYFYSLKEDKSIQLLNFGSIKITKKQVAFQPVILPEGKTTIWELFSNDSIFYCHENPWVIDIDGDTIPLRETDKGVTILDQFISIANVKQHKYSIVGSIFVTNNISESEYPIPHLSKVLVNSYRTNSIDYFFAKDKNTGIQSPKIQLSTPKPHLVLVDIYHPRKAQKGQYEPFYFFPQAKKWNYNSEKKQITACRPIIITFFDFYSGDFLTDFDSKNGVYKTSKWFFNEIFSPKEDVLLELIRQQEIYQKKRIPSTPKCSAKANSVKITEYKNLPAKAHKVRKNCKKKIKSLISR